MLWDPEPDNFTFAIENLGDLATWVSAVTDCSLEAAQSYLAEPAADNQLRERLRERTARHRMWSKREPPFGKRLGWYALARVLRPLLIVETGVHDGLGSLLLLRALERNQHDDGNSGKLVSFDVNPSAGWLVGDHPLWELRIQSSRDGLDEVLDREDRVGIFIYDGWHHPAAERHDHQRVLEHLAPDGVLVSDDAQTTRALADLAAVANLQYREFHEVPRHPFHPGSTLAAATAGREV